MENKIIVKLLIPEIDKEYDVYIPINRKIGNIIELLNKLYIEELNNNNITLNNFTELYDYKTGEKLNINLLLKNTQIRNNSKIILISNR